MERVAEEEQGPEGMLGGEQAGDPAAEALAAHRYLGTGTRLLEEGRHRPLGGSAGQLDGGRLEASPDKAFDIGQHRGCIAGRAVAEKDHPARMEYRRLARSRQSPGASSSSFIRSRAAVMRLRTMPSTRAARKLPTAPAGGW